MRSTWLRRGPLAAAVAAFVSALVVTLASTETPSAQTPAPAATDDSRIWQGVFTSAQADRGKAAYAAYCTRCHALDLKGGQGTGSGPALAGDTFWQSWERGTLATFYRKVSGQMPADSPASLRDNEYADIVSYLLASNGFPAGKTELMPDAGAMTPIRVVRQGVVAPEAPNFALVQVVGCLTPAPNGNWTLSRGTTPAVTRERAPTPASLQGAATVALGSETFRLLGARGFRPETHAGTRVDVRGLLNRVPSENRLDVLALSPLGGTCS
jgi:mono/diheme cytochrome c family protein